MGQLSPLVEQRLQALPDFGPDVKATKSLGKLFAALDQIVLGNQKDEYPAMTALKHLFGIGTRQPKKQCLPDFNRDFESRLGLLEPKLGSTNKDEAMKNLMSPVLCCAPYFAQKELKKDYSDCTLQERANVHKITSDRVKALLLLLVSRNPQGSLNNEMLKEKHNDFLGNQDTYPEDTAQSIRLVTDYKPSPAAAVANGSTFSITGTSGGTGSPIVCRLCGRAGVKSPDCDNPSCKAYYQNKRSGKGKPDSGSAPPQASAQSAGTQQTAVADEVPDDKPLSWITGMGFNVWGETIPGASEGDAPAPATSNSLADQPVAARATHSLWSVSCPDCSDDDTTRGDSHLWSESCPDSSDDDTTHDDSSGSSSAPDLMTRCDSSSSGSSTISGRMARDDSSSDSSISPDECLSDFDFEFDLEIEDDEVPNWLGPNVNTSSVALDSTNAQVLVVAAEVSSSAQRMAHSLLQEKMEINPFCLLLDTGSTHHIFNNRRLLTDVHQSNIRLRMKSQSGTKTVDEVGRFPGLRDKVWLDITGPMNVVSYGLLQDQYRMSYDNSHSNSFLVH